MGWASKLLALAVTGALGTNALDATIFTFSPVRDKQAYQDTVLGQQTVSEDVAGLILELRMKSSVASVLGSTGADTVDRLNQFAGTDSTLFGGPSDHGTTGRSIVFLEGVDGGVGMYTMPCSMRPRANDPFPAS